MGLRINTNVQSLAAQRNLELNSAAQKSSIEKLASGSRIVRAADDAAGLAISDKMKATIRSIRQDVRNANDGISMIQVAEGAMNETSNILTRFRELSVQAASDTIGDTERGFINKEVQSLKSEVERIAKSTEYNGMKLLTGEGKPLEVQIGIHNDASEDRFVFDPSKTNASLSGLGISDLSTSSKADAQANLDKIDSAIKSLAENRSELGAMQNRLTAVSNNAQVYEENLSAANSRIRDLDVASETAEMTKSNILSQSTVSVLSQANQSPMAALKLIG